MLILQISWKTNYAVTQTSCEEIKYDHSLLLVKPKEKQLQNKHQEQRADIINSTTIDGKDDH